MTDRDGPCEECGKYHDFRDDLVTKPAVHPLVVAERERITGEFDRSGNLHFTLAAVLAIVNPEAVESCPREGCERQARHSGDHGVLADNPEAER